MTRVQVRILMRIQMRALRGFLRTQTWMTTMVMACFRYTKYYLNLLLKIGFILMQLDCILGQLFWGDYSEL